MAYLFEGLTNPTPRGVKMREMAAGRIPCRMSNPCWQKAGRLKKVVPGMYYLKKGVTFNSGKEFGSEDV